MLIYVNGKEKEILTGEEIKEALGPEEWHVFCKILAEKLAPEVAKRLAQ